LKFPLVPQGDEGAQNVRRKFKNLSCKNLTEVIDKDVSNEPRKRRPYNEKKIVGV
jgi:hypothetical protein